MTYKFKLTIRFFAISDELQQSFVANRDADIIDAIFDVTGGSLFLLYSIVLGITRKMV
ncbi:MAG: hypothetical protein UR28_C0003G0071 [Candidatus Peregrinibacteria bacterium GW2011_GWF2_33_10]|nr:MAG: hypothetical protein UR28_C0003G0071 [Candidatus Peregrinibacteria bacterium GW2011_GWF2_33_10]